jgi:hypothetical protein
VQSNGNLMADDFVSVQRADNPARTFDMVIDPPITGSNGKEYETLHLEEPTGRMVERAEAELVTMNVHTLRKYQIALVSQASGTPRDVVEKMRISQIREAADFLSSFIGGGPPTGAS